MSSLGVLVQLIFTCIVYLQALDHEISVVGYGVTSDGTKYWIGRNSCELAMSLTFSSICII